MKLYDVELNDTEKGVYSISVVEDPAMEGMFIALKNQGQEVKLAKVDAEKRILMGVALVPDKIIYRNMDGNEFNIRFSKETVEKAAHLFLSNGFQNESSLEHSLKLNGMSVVESWIIEDEINDKSRKYGFDHPVGSWMVSMKVNDDIIWNEFVKEGRVKGFSIDGLFSLKELQLNKSNMSEEKKGLLDELKSWFKQEAITLNKEEVKKEEAPAEEKAEEVKLTEEPQEETKEEVKAETVEEAPVQEEQKDFSEAELKELIKEEIDTLKAEFTKQFEAKETEIKELKAELAKAEGATPTKHAPKTVEAVKTATTSKGRLTNFINTL